ncbi:EAL domain-containing protein [Paeniglutamicibacter sp. Y32M11]|uniref:sensor domain-containing phosphodiesterase n=1 Tax=Paeniglutamicibacter sp. Y32M11 TaxID=2853258 RepID=UPI001C52BD98|nr:EAL domain-containing protein [Paeniglutamicibacter sp. Y32M11]QXQ08761.1 EAL domain-containing protein [Paeniglutamicibacter sp. Y32M11]
MKHMTIGRRSDAPRRRRKPVPRNPSWWYRVSTPSWPARWLMVIVGIDALVALSIRGPMLFGNRPWIAFSGAYWALKLFALVMIPLVLYAVWRSACQQRRDRAEASRTAELMGTWLSTTQEFFWVTGTDGSFTFCGPASRDLLGYEPSELLGRPLDLILDPGDLSAALNNTKHQDNRGASCSGLVTTCRHRDGRRILVEFSFRAVCNGSGQNAGFEGTARTLSAVAEETPASQETKALIQSVLASGRMLTAFQPIRSLPTGAVIGVEALTRFPGTPGMRPQEFFTQAALSGVGVDAEIMALETALRAAIGVPSSLYVSVNLSPEACLDQRLAGLIDGSGLDAGRIVLEITEREPVHDYVPLVAALESLRAGGLRIAVDDAGAGFASMRHILQLRPDLIKLDRNIIAGIDKDQAQRALGAAMVGFAGQIHAVLIAEGIETEDELASVRSLGMDAGQGYLLGRPTTSSKDWVHWS